MKKTATTTNFQDLCQSSQAVRFAPHKMVSFKTHLQPDPTYYFGYDILENLGELIQNEEHDRVYLVTNEALNNLYGKEISEMFTRRNIPHDIIIISDSEHDKSFVTLSQLCDTLVNKFVTKGSLIIGFGGGCLTNIVGLSAGLIFRGIRYIEIPTTFMGITDSCLSNKQAVNGKYGKNQYGMYYAPIFIFGDTRFLQTESLAGRKSAIAEGIKNAFINNADWLPYYENVLEKADLNNIDPLQLTKLAYCVINSKLEILEQDPSEKLFAMALEYGHTFGHAIEFFSGGSIPHGIAVAKGMCLAAEISHQLGYMSREEVDKHYFLFGNRLNIELKIPEDISVDDIMDTILADNKKTVKGVKYVVLEHIGKCLNPDGDYQICVDPELVRRTLKAHNYMVDEKLGVERREAV